MSSRTLHFAYLACAFSAISAFAACGPAARELTDCNGAQVDTSSDPKNCGQCGSACAQGLGCTLGACSAETCNPGDMRTCYDGGDGTEGVGPCKGGNQTCPSSGIWGQCVGEVVPVAEVCGNGVDDDCNGMTDEDVDADGDGYTTCGGDCCDNALLCSNPPMVNPGAYDVPGDGIDNDCNGTVDDDPAPCDAALMSNSTVGTDFAKAIELCKSASASDAMKRWGVFSASLTQADGTATTPGTALKAAQTPQHAIRKKYGTGVTPKAGSSLVLLSTGAAAGLGDTNPSPDSGIYGVEDGDYGASSAFPPDYLSAHSGTLPNAPGCPAPNGSKANDPIMLTLSIRVPTNANSFTLETNFFSSEFPEYTCTPFNDFFVVLLDSTYSGTPANPTDKNLAFYTSSAGSNYPVGVNLAYGNTGLFTECKNGTTGCAGGVSGSINTCTEVTELSGTGMDASDAGQCDSDAQVGGGTGWLLTTGNVKPGETMTLRIAIWDTSDNDYDSVAVIDSFKWNADTEMPGTIISRTGPTLTGQPGAFKVDMPISRIEP